MKEPVSSTQYRFSYQIWSAKDLPADFHLLDKDLNFETGIFLPQDHSPDPHKGSTHPAKIFLLRDQCLAIYTHPTAHQAAMHIDLPDLQMVEHGRFLLLCWIRFFVSQSNCTFIFNSESSRVVDRFLKQMRHIWLPANTSTKLSFDRSQKTAVVAAFKFQKRLDRELDVNETVQKTFFIPPEKICQRKYLLRKVLHIPGDLLVITSRRVLWITDRERNGEGRELYGTIVRYAPIDKIGRISSDIQKLQVKLQMFHAG